MTGVKALTRLPAQSIFINYRVFLKSVLSEATIMKRRDFLKTSAVATAVFVTGPPKAQSAEREKPKVRRYQEIGKTGLKMSDISCGTGALPSSSMILRAIDRGINYFDTAPDYGSAEEYIGGAMKKIQRDKIIISSKFCVPYSYPGHIPAGSKKSDYIKAVEGSLSRMKTDYLDFCFVHAIGEQSKNKDQEMKRLFSDELFSAVQNLKKTGKIRFLAVSSHGPDNMESLLLEAVQSGQYDMIMPSFNFLKFPRIPKLLKEARKRGVGVVAMKTLAGAKDMDFDSKSSAFEPAAFKWVLSHPEVNGLVITIKRVSDLDLYLTASGEPLKASDRKVLDQYTRQYGKQYCRTGCNQCESDCPKGVSIATTLRYHMYFSDYGMEKHAMKSYARLQDYAEKCFTCDNESCVSACPYGLPVSELLREAHKILTFTA
jgi:predicted aldo/keto reductase-like oxidoreductase